MKKIFIACVLLSYTGVSLFCATETPVVYKGSIIPESDPKEYECAFNPAFLQAALSGSDSDDLSYRFGQESKERESEEVERRYRKSQQQLLGSGFEFDQDFADGEKGDEKEESVSPSEVVGWMAGEVKAGALHTVKSISSFFGNISAHKAPENQTPVDTALRKAHAIIGGQAVAAAKLGIKLPGIDEEKFERYRSEDGSYALIQEVTSGSTVTDFQERRIRAKVNGAQDLVFRVLRTDLPAGIEQREEADALLEIAQQVINNSECMQLLPVFLAAALQDKVVALQNSIKKLGGTVEALWCKEQRQCVDL